MPFTIPQALNTFNPRSDVLSTLLAGQQSQTGIEQNKQQREIIGLQNQLSQEGGGLDNPILQKLAAFSGDPQAAFGALGKSGRDSFSRDAQSGLNSFNQGDIQGIIRKAETRRARILKANPNANLQDTDDVINLANQVLNNPGDKALTARLGQMLTQGANANKDFNTLNERATPQQKNFRDFQSMPTKTKEQKLAKRQFGVAIGAISKSASIDEKIRLAQERGDIQTQQKLNEEKLLESKRQQIILNRLEIDETQIKSAELKKQAIDAKNSRRAESDNAVSIVDNLLSGDNFSSAFGKFNNSVPEIARPQENIDARAQVDQVLSLLSLESRQKLKGQGTISDSEAKTLEKSATLLANPFISDQLARKELRRVRRIFEDVSDRNQLLEAQQAQQQGQLGQPGQINTGVTPEQGQLQTLNFDAQGNLIP